MQRNRRQPPLFDQDPTPESDETGAGAPLAARMRPRDLDDYVGQDHIVGPGKILRRLIEAGQLPSLILWGPPGSGKTTLARIIASLSNARFFAVSAVSAGGARPRRAGPRPPPPSSTRSTASTRLSRTPSCPTSRTGP